MEPWICNNYKIYPVNPKHYKYYQSTTASLLPAENLDKKYIDSITDAIPAIINIQMIYEPGEPLVHLIG